MATSGAEVLILVPAGALVLLTLALVACGGGGVATSGPSVAAAAAKSAKARSVRMEMRMTLVARSLGEPVTLRLSGGLDRVGNRGKFRLDMSGIGDLAGVGELRDWRSRELVDAAGRKLVVYLGIPIFARAPGGRPWIKLDLAGARSGLDLAFAQVLQLMGNPGQTLDWLRATRGKGKTIGTERVGGEDTTHYRVIVDLTRWPRLVPPPRRPGARRAIATLRRLTHLRHLRAHPVHVWIAGDGLVRKMSVRFVERLQKERVLVAQTMWFHNFGSRVRVEIPPAGETTSLSALFAGLR